MFETPILIGDTWYEDPEKIARLNGKDKRDKEAAEAQERVDAENRLARAGLQLFNVMYQDNIRRMFQGRGY